MKRILLVLAVLCLSLQSLPAQKKGESQEAYRYYKAMDLLEKNGFTEEVYELLTDNISTNPKHILSYLPLVQAYRDAAKYNDALELINYALVYNHKNSEVSDAKLLWWKACIYQDFGNLEGAIELMEKAVKKARKSKESGLKDYQKALAQMYYDAGRYNDADKVYNALLKVNEDSQLALVGISRNLIARKEYLEALEVLDFCKKMDPDYYEIYRFQIYAYIGVGEYKKASEAMILYCDMTGDTDYFDYDVLALNKTYSIALLKQRIADNADNVVWKLLLAELYTHCNMYYESIQLYDAMIDEYGNDTMLLSKRAACYGSLGMTEFALADMEVAMNNADAESLPGLYWERSSIYSDAGMYAEALADVDEYVEANPTSVWGYYIRGIYQFYAANYLNAVSSFNDAVDINEYFSPNYLQRARAYLMMGQEEMAKADFETVLYLEDEPSTERAYALLYLGKVKEAMECVNTLMEAQPGDNGLYYDLACMFSLLDRGDDAMASLQTAFELGYKDIRHVKRDIDMDNIRGRKDFKELLEYYSAQLSEEVEKVYSLMASQKKQKVEEVLEPVYTEVAMKKQPGGTYEVPCTVNGLPLMMIFDTGASDVSISTVEASFMYKNGYLTDKDIKGSSSYVTADGTVHEGTVITLKEVKLGDAVLKNVQASVVHNQRAPLLLGQSVLEKFGTITIDNTNLKIIIQR